MDTETKARAEAALTENVATLATPELTPPKSEPKEPKPPAPASNRIPSIIVGVVVAALAGLSIWYLVRPQPLLVQGEVDATRFDIAARVDGRVAEVPVLRGQDVTAGAVLVRIDNPETIAKNEQALAANVVAQAQLANINAGTRAEVIAAPASALLRKFQRRYKPRSTSTSPFGVVWQPDGNCYCELLLCVAAAVMLKCAISIAYGVE